MTIPGLQLVDAFIEGGEVTEQETEGIVVSAFKAILTAGVLVGIIIAFNKMQAAQKK